MSMRPMITRAMAVVSRVFEIQRGARHVTIGPRPAAGSGYRIVLRDRLDRNASAYPIAISHEIGQLADLTVEPFDVEMVSLSCSARPSIASAARLTRACAKSIKRVSDELMTVRQHMSGTAERQSARPPPPYVQDA